MITFESEIKNTDLFTKRLNDFFHRDVTSFHEVPLTPLVFRHATSRKTLISTHPPMRDVIIEQLVKPTIEKVIAKVWYRIF